MYVDVISSVITSCADYVADLNDVLVFFTKVLIAVDIFYIWT